MVWKNKIERNRKNYKLLQEALLSQTATNDGMVLCSVDFSRSAVEKYRYFDEETYKYCLELLPPVKSDDNVLIYEDSEFVAAIKSLTGEKLPLYRLV